LKVLTEIEKVSNQKILENELPDNYSFK